MGTCLRTSHSSGARVCATSSTPRLAVAWGRKRGQLCSPYLPGCSRPQQRHITTCRASHYDLLGINSASSDEEIKTAFRRVAKKMHPDINKEDGAQERFMRINQAYTTLSDPKQRREYDQELRRGPARSPSGRPQRPSSGWVEYSWVVDMTEDSDDDEEDDDDDDDADEDILEFLRNVGNGSTYRSTFQSSWQANDKKRRAKEAAARAQAGRQPGRGAAAGAAKQRAGRPRSAEITDADRMEMLSSLRPDARYNAQKVFGRTLENLETWDQMADLLDVLEALDGSSLNIDFDDDDDDDDDGGRQPRRPSGSGRRTAASSPGRQAPSRGRSKAADVGLDLDWETLMHDFDSGSASASKTRYSQAPSAGRSPAGRGAGGRSGSSAARRGGASPRGEDGAPRQPQQGGVPPPKRPVHRAPAASILDDSDDEDDLDFLHDLVFGPGSAGQGQRPAGRARRPRGTL